MMRQTYSLGSDWRFHRGEIAVRNHGSIHANRFAVPEWMKAGNHALSKTGFPDEDWAMVSIPHDFVIDGTFSAEANVVHGSLPADVACYRKTFRLSAGSTDNCRVHLEFDGIYRDSTIWCNGHFVGKHLSGYTSVSFDVTEMLSSDGNNCVAVECDAREFELWSYEGGGIYRDARVVITPEVHIPYGGIHVMPRIPHESDPAEAVIGISARVINAGFGAAECAVVFQVLSSEATGNVLSTDSARISVGAGETVEVDRELILARPRLWEPADPHLYLLRTSIYVGDVEVDRLETRFGARSIRFDAAQGFSINGKLMKLKGVCEHQDHAGVGTAIPKELYRWRLGRLLEMGANALRTAHNPPAPALLDLCDELGILVIDEHRMPGTSPELLGQLESLVRRDRNHPCVILWSLGNEEMNIQEGPVGPRVMRVMQDLVHRLDPMRLCTYGSNCDFNAIADNFVANGFQLDVFGANYTMREGSDGELTAEAERYDEFHAKYPDWPLLATESGGSSSTRGLYGVEYYEGRPHLPAADIKPVETNREREGTSTAYSETLTPWGRTIEETWRDCATRDFVAGTFLWTGFDYRGETFPFGWPSVVTRYGLMDLCGFPKDAYFYYQSQWTTAPMLHLLPHWNWPGKEGELIDVWAYTNCSKVELFLNGQSCGPRDVPPYGKASWKIPYAAGELEAVGYDQAGNEISKCVRRTAGVAYAVRLQLDRSGPESDNRGLAVVRVEVVDREGNLVPDADNLVAFDLHGPAQIVGVGNGNPTSHEPDRSDRRKVYHGLAQVLIGSQGSGGKVTVLGKSEGLVSGQLQLQLQNRSLSAPSASIDGEKQMSFQPRVSNLNPVDGAL